MGKPGQQNYNQHKKLTAMEQRQKAMNQRRTSKLLTNENFTEQILQRMQDQNQVNKKELSREQYRNRQTTEEQLDPQGEQEKLMTKEERQLLRKRTQQERLQKQEQRKRDFKKKFQFTNKGQPVMKGMLDKLCEKLLKEQNNQEQQQTEQQTNSQKEQ